MPADRRSNNRKASASSSRFVLPYAKTNGYVGTPLSARAILFAPNVTPGTYLDTETAAGPSSEHASQMDAFLSPSPAPAPLPSRRREPPGKRRSQGYIPRPPNAFMLFRSDFVQSKHLPGSIQQGNLSLSRIIGNYWNGLLPEEKQEWEEKARLAKEEHAKMYPDYKFRPVHNKEKKAAKRKAKAGMQIEEEQRCDEVAQLLLEGKRGDDLVAAVRRLDLDRQHTAANTPESFAAPDAWEPPAPVYQPAPYYAGHRRSSSAPVPSHLYNPIRLPTLPFLLPSQPSPGPSRPPTRVGNISRSTRNVATRRASSVQPTPRPSWVYPMDMQLPLHMPVPAPMPPTWQRDWSPVPEPDTSLFEPAYVHGGSPFSQAQKDYAFPTCPPMQRQRLSLEIDPLDCGSFGTEGYSDVPTSALSSAPSPVSAYSYNAPFTHGPLLDTASSSTNGWTPTSGSTSALSASPVPSEHALAYALNAGLLAQQLQAQAQEQGFEGWLQQGPEQLGEPAAQHQQQRYDFGGVQMEQEYAQVAYSPAVESSELQLQGYAGVQMGMGEPSGSGSGSGWYQQEEQPQGYGEQYVGGVYGGEFAEDAYGLGDGAHGF